MIILTDAKNYDDLAISTGIYGLKGKPKIANLGFATMKNGIRVDFYMRTYRKSTDRSNTDYIDEFGQDEDGNIKIRFRKDWPKEWEAAYQHLQKKSPVDHPRWKD